MADPDLSRRLKCEGSIVRGRYSAGSSNVMVMTKVTVFNMCGFETSPNREREID